MPTVLINLCPEIIPNPTKLLAWQLVVAATHTGVFLAVTLKGKKKNPHLKGTKQVGRHTRTHTQKHTRMHTHCLLASCPPAKPHHPCPFVPYMFVSPLLQIKGRLIPVIKKNCVCLCNNNGNKIQLTAMVIKQHLKIFIKPNNFTQ